MSVEPATVGAGLTEQVPIVASDPDEAVEALSIDVDLDYDGQYDQSLSDNSFFEVTYEELGLHYAKVRVVDSGGKQATTLALINVEFVPGTGGAGGGTGGPAPSGGAAEEDDGCGCRSRPVRRPYAGLSLLAVLLALHWRRRRVS